MTRAHDVIIRPIVTEKSLKTQENDNTVVFEVAKGTNKVHVKKAIEEIFKVEVEKVNIRNSTPKTRYIGRYRNESHTKAIRKAYIKLKPGHKIDILSDK